MSPGAWLATRPGCAQPLSQKKKFNWPNLTFGHVTFEDFKMGEYECECHTPSQNSPGKNQKKFWIIHLTPKSWVKWITHQKKEPTQNQGVVKKKKKWGGGVFVLYKTTLKIVVIFCTLISFFFFFHSVVIHIWGQINNPKKCVRQLNTLFKKNVNAPFWTQFGLLLAQVSRECALRWTGDHSRV